MPDPTTPAKGLTQPTVGADNNTWGGLLNTNLALIDSAIGGTLALSISGTTSLSSIQAQNGGYEFTGTLSGTATITWPAFSGFSIIQNGTTGGFSITCGLSGGGTVTVLNGETVAVWCDGTNFARLAAVGGGGTLATANGGTNKTSWTTGSIPYLSSSAGFAEDNSALSYTSTGGLVLSPHSTAPGLTMHTTTVFQGIVIDNGVNPVVKILNDQAGSPPDGGVVAVFYGGGDPQIEWAANSASFMQLGHNVLFGANGKVYTPDQQVVIAAGQSLAWQNTSSSPTTSDTGVSRLAAGSLAFGNGTPGNTSATMSAANLNLGTSTNRFMLTLESATQFQGFDLWNGTNDVVKIHGTTSTNDGGSIDLLSGGTVAVELTTNGTSYFNAGSLAVGATTPAAGAKFSVTSATQFDGIVISNATHSIVKLFGAAANNEAGAMQLFNNNTLTAVIATNASSFFNGGDVGIGNNSPQATLHVTGTVIFQSLPTSDPHVVNELWNNSGVLTVSAG